MDTYTFLQHYWWFLLSLLGGLLVFLFFVQGGQSLLFTLGKTETQQNMLWPQMGTHLHDLSYIRRSFLCLFSPILLNKFQWSLLDMDTLAFMFRYSSRILRVSGFERELIRQEDLPTISLYQRYSRSYFIRNNHRDFLQRSKVHYP